MIKEERRHVTEGKYDDGCDAKTKKSERGSRHDSVDNNDGRDRDVKSKKIQERRHVTAGEYDDCRDSKNKKSQGGRRHNSDDDDDSGNDRDVKSKKIWGGRRHVTEGEYDDGRDAKNKKYQRGRRHDSDDDDSNDLDVKSKKIQKGRRYESDDSEYDEGYDVKKIRLKKVTDTILIRMKVKSAVATIPAAPVIQIVRGIIVDARM